MRQSDALIHSCPQAKKLHNQKMHQTEKERLSLKTVISRMQKGNMATVVCDSIGAFLKKSGFYTVCGVEFAFEIHFFFFEEI